MPASLPNRRARLLALRAPHIPLALCSLIGSCCPSAFAQLDARVAIQLAVDLAATLNEDY